MEKSIKFNLSYQHVVTFCGMCSILALSEPSMASTASTGLPWEGPLSTIGSSLQGPVATSLAVIALVGAAFSFMFLEVGKGMRWFLTAVIGFSIVSTAYGLMGVFGLTTALA